MPLAKKRHGCVRCVCDGVLLLLHALALRPGCAPPPLLCVRCCCSVT
jgi:hypothetical protein